MSNINEELNKKKMEQIFTGQNMEKEQDMPHMNRAWDKPENPMEQGRVPMQLEAIPYRKGMFTHFDEDTFKEKITDKESISVKEGASLMNKANNMLHDEYKSYVSTVKTNKKKIVDSSSSTVAMTKEEKDRIQRLRAKGLAGDTGIEDEVELTGEELERDRERIANSQISRTKEEEKAIEKKKTHRELHDKQNAKFINENYVVDKATKRVKKNTIQYNPQKKGMFGNEIKLKKYNYDRYIAGQTTEGHYDIYSKDMKGKKSVTFSHPAITEVVEDYEAEEAGYLEYEKEEKISIEDEIKASEEREKQAEEFIKAEEERQAEKEKAIREKYGDDPIERMIKKEKESGDADGANLRSVNGINEWLAKQKKDHGSSKIFDQIVKAVDILSRKQRIYGMQLDAVKSGKLDAIELDREEMYDCISDALSTVENYLAVRKGAKSKNGKLRLATLDGVKDFLREYKNSIPRPVSEDNPSTIDNDNPMGQAMLRFHDFSARADILRHQKGDNKTWNMFADSLDRFVNVNMAEAYNNNPASTDHKDIENSVQLWIDMSVYQQKHKSPKTDAGKARLGLVNDIKDYLQNQLNWSLSLKVSGGGYSWTH